MSKKKRKKQSSSRDTKFAHYAAKIWHELDAVFAVEGIKIDRWFYKKVDEVAEATLAKQLYDFAGYVTDHMIFTYTKDIPDLREGEGGGET